MKDALAGFLAPREEKVELAGQVLIVREMGTAADVVGFRDGKDAVYKFMVRCTFDEAGESAFSDEDIPALKKAPMSKLRPLIEAVERVMGFDVEGEVKNSPAVPSAG